ncbi:MAG TPA: FtsX-like permease family protein, partial [Vicinamibacterales bacterium]|nr:FtsX-like permease family protein [Vicinamibacterales bacterium]
GHTWTALIIAQVAIAVAGLPAAVAVGWSVTRSTMTVPAFDEVPFLAAAVSPDPDPPVGQSSEEYARESQQRFAKLKIDLLASLEAEPIVVDVTAARAMPGDEPWVRLEIDGETPPQSGAPIARYNHVAVDFFDAFNGRVLAGRPLAMTDAISSPAVVVNAAFVTKMLGGGTAIGRRLRYVGASASRKPAAQQNVPWYEIVGVVSDLHANTVDPAQVNPVVYHAARDTESTLLIRVRGAEPQNFAARVRQLTAALDPSTRLQVVALSETKRQAAVAFRLAMLAVSLVVVSVLLLSAAGLYALMSFTVSHRRKEIGIRAAMGADARQLLRNIFAKAAWQLSAGIGMGVTLALLADSVSGGELLGGSFGRAAVPVMGLVMLAVGLVAAAGPARRGLRISPTEALRAE